MSLKKYLIEGSKNLHQEHLEDEIFNLGKEGLKNIATNLKSIAQNKKDKFTITVKFDGSPAVVFGILPNDVVTSSGVKMTKGQFFVGTKGVFNATPKIAPTPEATEQLYGGELGLILKSAHKLLAEVYTGNDIFQGDLMYLNASQRGIESKIIDGTSYFTFKPNTILYAIPENSKIGNDIKGTELGIAVHTRYSGNILSEMNSSFDVSENQFKKSSSVWLIDAKQKNISDVPLLTDEATKRVTGMANFIFGRMNNIPDDLFEGIANLKPQYLIKTFINSRIRMGQSIGDSDGFVKGFEDWMSLRTEKEKEKVTTEVSKEKKETLYKNNMEPFYNNPEGFINLIKLYKVALKAKETIVEALNNSTQEIQTYLLDETELKRTHPEGYCLIDVDNKILKLVNRLEFSAANFAT